MMQMPYQWQLSSDDQTRVARGELPMAQRQQLITQNAMAKAAARKGRLYGPAYSNSMLLNSLAGSGDNNMLAAMLYGPEAAAEFQRNKNWADAQAADRSIKKEALKSEADNRREDRASRVTEAAKDRAHSGAMADKQFANAKTLDDVRAQREAAQKDLDRQLTERLAKASSSEQAKQAADEIAVKKLDIESRASAAAEKLGLEKTQTKLAFGQAGVDLPPELSGDPEAETASEPTAEKAAKEAVEEPSKAASAFIAAIVRNTSPQEIRNDPEGFRKRVVEALVKEGKMTRHAAEQEFQKAFNYETVRSGLKGAGTYGASMAINPIAGPLVLGALEKLTGFNPFQGWTGDPREKLLGGGSKGALSKLLGIGQ